jgi:hypothetical protein
MFSHALISPFNCVAQLNSDKVQAFGVFLNRLFTVLGKKGLANKSSCALLVFLPYNIVNDARSLLENRTISNVNKNFINVLKVANVVTFVFKKSLGHLTASIGLLRGNADILALAIRLYKGNEGMDETEKVINLVTTVFSSISVIFFIVGRTVPAISLASSAWTLVAMGISTWRENCLAEQAADLPYSSF